ncbi:Iron-sulfur cluster carrier protein [Methylacidimicrobium tartarophylax]|uniref:Iron-sulfur cluster carrier protein n=1 Tax=Methylacidimicrobium tartarophylax TaxID=1041768 RepID=A0A5E6ME51_9BACT|nr:Mrp/NBP35 family ATP-binding protein [Methylacidimicrobium tartarophylax]VVM07752.1 Iron-sulfur cluster carrier protein [Methylacidimicrobium tartarophylax]
MPESLTTEAVRQELRKVKYPGFSRDIVSFGLVKEVSVADGTVSLRLEMTTADPQVPAQIEQQVRERLARLPGVARVEVAIAPSGSQPAARAREAAPSSIRHIVAVASGKGGVGKSTVAANLAVALQKEGAKAAGLCDCDIYGPSIPLMLGTRESPQITSEQRLVPIERFGLRIMSMGLLLDSDQPAVLRGPMVTRYTQEFLRNVDWGDLDVLVLDLPPGTGDIQLTIVQTVRLSGAVVVTTPQEVALIDARKAVGMFGKVNVPLLGILENMSYFLCPNDQNRYDIFGAGGGRGKPSGLACPFSGRSPWRSRFGNRATWVFPSSLRSPIAPRAEPFGMRQRNSLTPFFDRSSHQKPNLAPGRPVAFSCDREHEEIEELDGEDRRRITKMHEIKPFPQGTMARLGRASLLPNPHPRALT